VASPTVIVDCIPVLSYFSVVQSTYPDASPIAGLPLPRMLVVRTLSEPRANLLEVVHELAPFDYDQIATMELVDKGDGGNIGYRT
jgi:hypothetical protein